jgi:hypothetical protein
MAFLYPLQDLYVVSNLAYDILVFNQHECMVNHLLCTF